ncbi:restriction endonuclease subunit S [Schnuerera sp.]|uniref:restriction endonuclease subunit S n=1 Tax=Schnuerera sp. TaxID=2794844 RepID=UPI002C407319|nr:restriction endonuclease subunit S [Schnuerera sp.]HSH35105.1 restriction endonuclease subunit S [Schnuerera sp.]
MRLEDIADITQGITLSRIRIEDNMEVEDKIVYSFETESKVKVPKDVKKVNQNIPVIEKDMILFNITSYNAKKATKEDLGKIVPSNYVIVKIKDENVNSDYLAWYMDQSESFRREIHKLKQGSTVLSISINEFRKMSIKLPRLEFQQKLGKINNLNRKRKELFIERQTLIEKSLITINEEEMRNG